MKQNLEEILKQEYDKEAEEITRRVEEREKTDPEFAALEVDESMQMEFLQMLDAYEEKMANEVQHESVSAVDYYADEVAVSQLSKEGQEAYRLGKELLEKQAQKDSEKETPTKVVKIRKKRVYLLVALVAILAMAFGMTSMGGRTYVMDMVSKVFYGKDQTRMNSEEQEREYTDIEVDEVFAEIDEKLGIDVVALPYIPEDFVLAENIIEDEIDRAYVSYGNNDRWINYYIYGNQSDQSSSTYHDDTLLSEESMFIDDICITISKYEDVNNVIFYEATYVYKNVNYRLLSNIEYEEFSNILKNLFFY